MKQALAAKNISYKYKKNRVLENISFFVQKGEFFIVIGPNGSGKTTIAKIIAGIIKPEKGRVKISGLNIDNYSVKKLAQKIAFVPQDIPIDFPFGVKEIAFMGRYPHNGFFGIETEKDMEIVKQAMEFTAVASLADRKLSSLSGGEKQRVFIASAICQQSEIIILDEPTAALDLSHQIHIMDLLCKLKKKENLTIIMISHDLNLAAMYGEKILLLKNGKIAKIGAPSEVMTKPILESIYECELIVNKSELGDFPIIHPVSRYFL